MVFTHRLSRSTHRLLHIITILLVAATLCTRSTTAQTSPPLAQPAQLSFLGMNTYFTGLERISRDSDAGIATLETMGRAAGVTWAREELSWGNLERKSKGSFDWNYFDKRLLEMARSGYGIVGMLLTSPEWARVGDCASRLQRFASAGVHPQNYWCPPANMQDYADYVRATVERYDGDGFEDAPGSPRVAVWQLWNEPNAWETWPGSSEEYGALLVAGYTAAKSADPSAVVATGGLYVFDGSWSDGKGHSDGLRFLDAAVRVPGAWSSFDVLAIHPYMPDVAPDQPNIVPLVSMWGRISTARDWLAAHTALYGGPARQLWISEVGWSTCHAGQADCYVGASVDEGQRTKDEESATMDSDRWPMTSRPSSSVLDLSSPIGLQSFIGKTEEQQADYMVRTAAIARALGVSHMSYFQFEDKFDGSAGNFWEEASIVGTKATGYRPKLAYSAYGVLANQLGDTVLAGLGPLHTYTYNPGGQRNAAARYNLRFLTADNVVVDVLWQSDGKQSTVSLPLEPGRNAELVTRDGAVTALPINNDRVTFSINDHPVYLRQLLPPGLAVQPNSITALTEVGGPPRSFTLSFANTGSGALTWNATSDSVWLRLGATSGQGRYSGLAFTIEPAGLAPGSYSAIISVTSNGGTQQVPVRLLVVGQVWRSYFPIGMR